MRRGAEGEIDEDEWETVEVVSWGIMGVDRETMGVGDWDTMGTADWVGDREPVGATGWDTMGTADWETMEAADWVVG